MLLFERTFEDLESDPDIGSKSLCAIPAPEPKQLVEVSTMATIGPQIEAEIPFLWVELCSVAR